MCLGGLLEFSIIFYDVYKNYVTFLLTFYMVFMSATLLISMVLRIASYMNDRMLVNVFSVGLTQSF